MQDFGVWPVRICLCAGLLLAGCASPAEIPAVPTPVLPGLETAKTPIPFKIRDIDIAIAPHAELGAFSAGFACIPQGTLKWHKSDFGLTEKLLDEVFYVEATAAGYPIAINPASPFASFDDGRTTLWIAGAMRELRLNACYPLSPLADRYTSRAEALVTMDWRIYDRRAGGVVARIVTRGDGRVTKSGNGGDVTAILAAYSEAVRGLLAAETFLDRMLADPSAEEDGRK